MTHVIATAGPYRGRKGRVTATRPNGMLVVTFVADEMHSAVIGIMDPRWVKDSD